MDSTRNEQLRAAIASIPRIAERPAQWVAAAPSRLLHGGIGVAWLGFLWTLGIFTPSNGGGAIDLSFVDSLALAMFLVTLAGIFTVVAFAMSNSMATAPVSVICGLAVIVVAAMCGFSGHPATAWGPDAVLAAGIVAVSLFVMGRRAA